jgi:hypothetical protein
MWASAVARVDAQATLAGKTFSVFSVLKKFALAPKPVTETTFQPNCYALQLCPGGSQALQSCCGEEALRNIQTNQLGTMRAQCGDCCVRCVAVKVNGPELPAAFRQRNHSLIKVLIILREVHRSKLTTTVPNDSQVFVAHIAIYQR